MIGKDKVSPTPPKQWSCPPWWNGWQEWLPSHLLFLLHLLVHQHHHHSIHHNLYIHTLHTSMHPIPCLCLPLLLAMTISGCRLSLFSSLKTTNLTILSSKTRICIRNLYSLCHICWSKNSHLVLVKLTLVTCRF